MNVGQHVSQYVKVVEDLQKEILELRSKVEVYENKEISTVASTSKENALLNVSHNILCQH